MTAAGSRCKPRGVFKVEHWRQGKLLGVYEAHNDTTTEGLDALNDIMFGNATQIPTWYISLIDNAGYTALAAGDTMSSHAGWAENTDYDEATRVAWTEGSSSSGVLTNASTVNFTMNATVSIKGLFLVAESTKGGTTTTLYSTAAFTTAVPLVSSDSFRTTYTITMTDQT